MTLTLAALGMIGPFTINTVFPVVTRIGEEFGAVVADSMGVLIVPRVLQGMRAGAATIVSRVVVRDLFAGPAAQRLMAQVMMIFAFSPMVAPMLGGWLLLLGDWRWAFAGMGLYGAAALIATALMPESLPREARIPLRIGAVLGALWEVGRSPVLVRIALTTAFGFAAHFVFVAAAPIIVVRLLGLGEQDVWVLFGPLILGMIAGSWVVARAAEAMERSHLITAGVIGTLAMSVVNLVLVTTFPDPSGQLDASLLPVLVGPALMSSTASLFFALAALGHVVVGCLLWARHHADQRRRADVPA